MCCGIVVEVSWNVVAVGELKEDFKFKVSCSKFNKEIITFDGNVGLLQQLKLMLPSP